METPDDLPFFTSTTEMYVNTTLSPPVSNCTDWPSIPMTSLIPSIYSLISLLGTVANSLAVCVLAHSSATRSVANTFCHLTDSSRRCLCSFAAVGW